MQEHGGQDAAEAIESAEREFSARLRVDWDRDGNYDHPLSDLSGYATAIDIDRAWSGGAPEEIALIEGSAAAELTITLAGHYDGRQMSSVFSPYNAHSPFYGQTLDGCDVVYEIDVHTTSGGVVTYPQFVGTIRGYDLSRGDGEVELTALDRVEKLRSPVRLPRWAVSRYWENQGRRAAQLADGQWLIDHCLRSCGVSSTGHTWMTTDDIEIQEGFTNGFNRARFFLSGTGAIAPNVGWFDNFTAQRFPDIEGGADAMYVVDGAQEPALSDDPDAPLPLCFSNHTSDYQSKFWVDNRDPVFPQWGHYLSAQLITRSGTHQNTNGAPLISINLGTRDIELYVSEGNVWALWRNRESDTTFTTAEHAIPGGADSVHVEACVEFSDEYGLRAYIGFDGSPNAWEQLYSGTPPETIPWDPLKGLVTVNRVVRFNDLAYQKDNFSNPRQNLTTLIKPSDYRAALDRSKNRLVHFPRDRSDDDAWTIIKDVVAAEAGAAFWDESGTFRFWNRDRITQKQNTIVRTVTVDDLSALGLSSNIDSVRNVYTVETQSTIGVNGIAYEADDPDLFHVPAQNDPETTRYHVAVDNIVYPRPYTLVQHDTLGDEGSGFPQWSDQVAHGFVPQWHQSGQWEENQTQDVGGLHICWLNRDGRLTFQLNNNFNDPMRLAMDPTSSGGQSRGALRIMGSLLEDQGSTTTTMRDVDSIRRYGRRNLKLSGDWHQDISQSEGLASELLARTTEPMPATDDIEVPGDPRLQLGDTIEIADPYGLGTLTAQIYGISREFSGDSGLTDTLTVELIRQPVQWVLGDPHYSILGQSTIL
ncbi:hypothetical protein [Actinopolyspora halophila]|uniref:hypothetical protein n=1 Tax=Actinopolyspora halophila TaxID=1850 RepID=UPI0003685DAC|nr:hypothetical protein [Actinopolyspora halophila]